MTSVPEFTSRSEVHMRRRPTVHRTDVGWLHWYLHYDQARCFLNVIQRVTTDQERLLGQYHIGHTWRQVMVTAYAHDEYGV